ncbi:hypothetical protein LSAT2_029528 [Lamellibrachia satsuma]|nr:hypothetical protein LSAT2_029528 [Lamellibrachia satsuma]
MLRLIHNSPKSGSCRRWYFTLNGNECREPNAIDTQIYTDISGKNIHRHTNVEGYCRGIAAGSVQVQWNIGDCITTTYDTGDSYTGWDATVRIIVEEVDVNDANSTIV